MIQFETKFSPKRRKKVYSKKKLYFLIFTFGVIISLIFFLWFDYSYPTYGSESFYDRYFSTSLKSKTFGIYINPELKLPDTFSISDFFKTYSNFKITTKQHANIVLDLEELKNVQTLEIPDPNTEVIMREIFVPIMKFGNLKRSISLDEYNKIVILETEISQYFKNDIEYTNLSCEEVKNRVNENDELGIVSLSCLDSSVSVLAVDDISIFGQVIENNRTQKLDDEFRLISYQPKYEVWLNYGDNENLSSAVNYIKESFSNSVVELGNANSLVMTGVTAMGRGTMWKIRDYGTTYPIEKVADVLKDADLAHTSNEVSFVPGCTQESHTMSFCALPQSIDTLTYAGIDVVELTGNHNNDKGWSYNKSSMELYTEKGMTYVGGGLNETESYTVKYTNFGNYKIGWFGFSEGGPVYAWASDTIPGAAEYNEDKLVELAKEASENADIAIMVFQWANENYSYPTEFQKFTARLAIDNGADLVVGSQGHGTLKMEFYNGVPIYYGLGNFLFDQMFSDKVRSGMILRVNTIDGKIKNLEMLPYMLENYCQPNFVYDSTAKTIIDNVVKW